MFQVNFRANPKPSDCQWKQIAAENQSSKSCLIESNGNENGEYFVNFSQTQVRTQESSMIINITNDIGMSPYKFDLVLPELYLRIENKLATDAIKIDLKENKETSIDCVAVGVYSKPEFRWFLANESLNTTNAVIEIEPLDKKVSYTSTLTYKGSSKDLNKTLKCEIHQIHNKTGLQIDVIETEAELDIG